MSKEDYWVEMTKRYVTQLVFLAILILVILVAVPDWTFKGLFAVIVTVIYWFVFIRNSSELE
ncbi:MAG: hypothetical protein ACW98U_03100 [Candidatus Thorarchaeota archaeon]|jgi:heme A synthase